jgi:hypothetical protein
MRGVTVVTHGDVDGLVSLTLFLKRLGSARCRIYFTSPSRLRNALCASIVRGRLLKEVYLFDLTPNPQLALLSAVYGKALWIDHHVWESFKPPPNVKLIINPKSPSTAQLVSEHFKVYSKLVDWVNEIDMDRVRSEDACYLRDLIGAIKRVSSNIQVLNQRLRKLAEDLAFLGFQEVREFEESKELVSGYRKWVRKAKATVARELKALRIDGLRLALYEGEAFIPAYVVCEVLRKQRKTFDIIAVITKRAKSTHVDLRTMTGFKVLKLAKHLGGGGHEVACSATLPKPITAEQFIESVRKAYGLSKKAL